MPEDSRVPVIVVAGLAADAAEQVSTALRVPGTAVVRHDLSRLSEGVVLRRLRLSGSEHTQPVELKRGCVSCTLREDLLPLVRTLAARPDVRRIVLHLDPALEPEAICWELRNVVVGEQTLEQYTDLRAVITVLDAGRWLDHATSDDQLAEHGLAVNAEDERTLAQVAVDTVEFADALVVAGQPDDAWLAARTTAVLDRLAPRAPRHPLDGLDAQGLLDAIGDDARRGEPDSPHGPLLRGRPPLDPDCGVGIALFSETRPFHPERLHQAFDVLLDGVVCSRGRVWVASRPDRVLWLESAGGGLRVGDAGPWLAAVSEADWVRYDDERRALAAGRWHPEFGDRAQELMAITDGASPERITDALQHALLSDEELAEGRQAWARYPDPFGSWHTDPCDELDDTGNHAENQQGNRRDQR